jgi:hypothetical protein
MGLVADAQKIRKCMQDHAFQKQQYNLQIESGDGAVRVSDLN